MEAVRVLLSNYIKNSTHSNDKTISKVWNIFIRIYYINLFALKWWTNITFQNVSLKGLKRKQNALKLETTRVFSQFFVEGNNISVQRNVNMHFESKT